ncbi:MAG: iron ABC transporter permease [Lachnospiraceae bacterium]|nr:iron ABC transporter permease [Lachnospiraceae bacterium]
MPTGLERLEQIRAIRAAEKKKKRRQRLFVIALLVGLSFAFLCIEGRGVANHSPLFVIKSIGAFVRFMVQTAGQGHEAKEEALWQIYAALGNSYAAVVSRLQSVLLIIICGAVLALSGSVYQTSMRNPMAVPTMLGVSSGVQMAQMILVLLYAEDAYNMGVQRYVLSYGISIGVLLVILIAARIVGRDHASVSDLLILGTIVNRLFQTIMNYYQSNMDNDTLEIYQEFSQNSQDYFDSFSDLTVLIVVAAATMVPLILMRFSFNVVSFEDEDAHSVGVRAKFMRVYGIIAGGILTATAMIHAGNIGMLATVVPLLCRYLYGADFRDLLWMSAAWGGIILLGAQFVRDYTYINTYQIPLGNIVSLLAVPLLIWIIRRQQKIFPSMER